MRTVVGVDVRSEQSVASTLETNQVDGDRDGERLRANEMEGSQQVAAEAWDFQNVSQFERDSTTFRYMTRDDVNRSNPSTHDDVAISQAYWGAQRTIGCEQSVVGCHV